MIAARRLAGRDERAWPAGQSYMCAGQGRVQSDRRRMVFVEA